MLLPRTVPLLLSASLGALFLAGCGSDGDAGAAGPTGPSGPVSAGVELRQLGRFQHRDGNGDIIFNTSAAEITAFHAATSRIFVVNALLGGVDVLDGATPVAPTLIQFVDVASLVEAAQSLADGALGPVNSVAISGNVAAVAVEAVPKTDNGYIAFLNCTTLALLGSVEVGALPDMVAFTPDGTKVLSANEGEPADFYAINPPGTVSIIDVSGGFVAPPVTSVDFTDWDVGGPREGEVANLRTRGLRFDTIVGAAATFSEDMEPEYLAVSADSATAYVALQENNAIAVIDIATGVVDRIMPLGFKDHGITGNEADFGERDVDGSGGSGGFINIRTWGGVVGCYMPDTISTYTVGSKTYIVTANEGDAREWPEDENDFADVARLGSVFNGGNPLTGRLAGLEGNINLGRLNILKDVSTSSRVVALGGRSFSIWDAQTGVQVFDSGSEIERITAQRYPQFFNASSTNNTLDNRSDDKGPEPEGLAIGKIGQTTYAFVGLERVGGIMVYDISNPQAATFVSYFNGRDFTQTPAAGAGGDLAPEGLTFVPAAQSPNGVDLLIVGYETSGTTVIYEVADVLDPPTSNN